MVCPGKENSLFANSRNVEGARLIVPESCKRLINLRTAQKSLSHNSLHFAI